MNIYIPSWAVWYILGCITPFALVILWGVAGKIAGRSKPKDEDSLCK